MKANHAQVTRLIKTARGQLDGILKMVEEDRYCVDISHQLMATTAILNKVNKEVIKAHLDCCVKAAIANNESEEKMTEIFDLIDKIK